MTDDIQVFERAVEVGDGSIGAAILHMCGIDPATVSAMKYERTAADQAEVLTVTLHQPSAKSNGDAVAVRKFKVVPIDEEQEE